MDRTGSLFNAVLLSVLVFTASVNQFSRMNQKDS